MNPDNATNAATAQAVADKQTLLSGNHFLGPFPMFEREIASFRLECLRLACAEYRDDKVLMKTAKEFSKFVLEGK